LLYPPVLSRIESNLKKSIKSLELGLVGTPQRKRFNFKKTRYVYPMVTLFKGSLCKYPLFILLIIRLLGILTMMLNKLIF
jgi:hypothetical protein